MFSAIPFILRGGGFILGNPNTSFTVVVVLRSPIHANEPSEYNGMLYRTSNRVLNNGIKVIILICMDGTSQYHHYQLYRMTPLSYHGYSVSGSSSQQYGFHQFFFIIKTFRDSRLLKYLINKELMTFSNKIQAKTFTMLDSLHWCAKQRNRTSLVLGELWYTYQSFSIIIYFNL